MSARLAAVAALAGLALLTGSSSAGGTPGCAGRGGSIPAWSPTGHEIAWLTSDADGLCFAKPDGRDRQFFPLNATHGRPSELLWPRPGFLVALSDRKVYSIGLWPTPHFLPLRWGYAGDAGNSIALDAGGRRLVTETCAGRCAAHIALMQPGGSYTTYWSRGRNSQPSLSPNGENLVWQAWNHTILIRSADAARDRPRVIARGRCPLWSPAGRKIAVLRAGLNIFTPEGEQVGGFADGEADVSCSIPHTHIAWSPNGRYIAFINIARRLSVVDVEKGPVNAPTPFHEINSLAWSPDSRKLLLGVATGSCSALWRLRLGAGPPVLVSGC